MDTAAKTGLDALKAASKKATHKTAKITGELIGIKIVEKVVKRKPASDENLRDVEEVIIPPEKREQRSNELRQVL